MLVVHLAFGLVFGVVAAALSVVLGYSFWAVVGFYILGANLGLLASLPAALLKRPGRTTTLGPVTNYQVPSTAAPLR